MYTQHIRFVSKVPHQAWPHGSAHAICLFSCSETSLFLWVRTSKILVRDSFRNLMKAMDSLPRKNTWTYDTYMRHRCKQTLLPLLLAISFSRPGTHRCSPHSFPVWQIPEPIKGTFLRTPCQEDLWTCFKWCTAWVLSYLMMQRLVLKWRPKRKPSYWKQASKGV